MTVVTSNGPLLARLEQDEYLSSVTLEFLSAHYSEVSEKFHHHFTFGGEDHHQNAIFHQIRYLALLRKKWSGRVLDVGNDKPFLSYYLRRFNPGAVFSTISYELPETPVELHVVDIEQEKFPFEDGVFDQVIFTEVIEHLWRNPSHCVFEINRVLRVGGVSFVTTPNACDRHSLVCILWQANPNQRSGYYVNLESGHLHLWTLAQLKTIFEAHAFEITAAGTEDLYGHTKPDEVVDEFIRKVCPHRDLMNETLVIEARKSRMADGVQYPRDIFPDGCAVKFEGSIVSFANA